jgi:hypothetical protein
MPDIARIRIEMKTLIEGLTGVYLPWKQEENRKEREEKAAARKAKAEQKMSEHESSKEKPSTDIEAANESASSATAVLPAPKTGEDDNVKAVANSTNGDMDIDDESSPQEIMIV